MALLDPERQSWAQPANRECTICPPQVEMCTHYDGQWVIFHDQASYYSPMSRWLVCSGLDKFPPLFEASVDGFDDHLGLDYHTIQAEGNDRAKIEEAYHRVVEELRTSSISKGKDRRRRS